MLRQNQYDDERPQDGDQPPKTRKFPPLPALPEREWLNAIIADVEYRYVRMNGEIQLVRRVDGEIVTDPETKLPIKRTEFALTFWLNDYSLPGDEAKPRQVWMNISHSYGQKAHLPVFLRNLNIEIDPDNPLPPNQIISQLSNLPVKLQVGEVRVSAGGKPYQKVIWDSVKRTVKEAAPEGKQPSTNQKLEQSKRNASPIPATQEVAWDE